MTPACAAPIAWEAAVAYFAGDLPPDAEDAVEVHVMGCAACTELLARVAAITEAVRAMIPPIITRAALDALQARGVRVRESAFTPGDRRVVAFTPDVDVLVHRLEGADLAAATRVDVALRDEASGSLLLTLGDVPFDARGGVVLVTCQRHNAAMPPDIVFEVTAHGPSGPALAARYTVLHDYGAPASAS